MENIKTLDSYIKLVQLLIEKPAVFGINRVEDIFLVLQGYTFGSNVTEIHDFHLGFSDYVFQDSKERFKSDDSIHWVTIVRFFSTSDQHTLKLFKTYFEKYLKSI